MSSIISEDITLTWMTGLSQQLDYVNSLCSTKQVKMTAHLLTYTSKMSQNEAKKRKEKQCMCQTDCSLQSSVQLSVTFSIRLLLIVSLSSVPPDYLQFTFSLYDLRFLLLFKDKILENFLWLGI